MKVLGRWSCAWVCFAFMWGIGVSEASTESSSHSTPWGELRFGGSADTSHDVLGLSLWTELRKIAGSRWFASMAGEAGRERYPFYDLNRWAGALGIGRILSDHLDAEIRYRWQHIHLFHIDPGTDPAIRSVAGSKEIGTWMLGMKLDTRDDAHRPTKGVRGILKAEAALRQFGSDHRFVRLEGDWAWYGRPFLGWKEGWEDLVLAEHLAIGWVEDFEGEGGEVPFFERYFVGGSSTVRGHRRRWLSPRGMGGVFVGGHLQLINNIELRLPILKDKLHRRLWTAAFFDVGRAFRRISEVGDFGYGVGIGLRYVVDLWEIHGVLRADYGFNPAREGDDTRSTLHVTFGMPF
jgi:outer membrane protein insertion porin family